MSMALEVSFRGLPPNETLVAMAAEQYRLFKRDQPELGECLVVLQAVQGTRTRALVRFGAPGTTPPEQAEAEHRVPSVALRRALSALRARIAGGMRTSFAAREKLSTALC